MRKTEELEQLGGEEVRVHREIANLRRWDLSENAVVKAVISCLQSRLEAMERRRDELEHGGVKTP